MFSRTIGAAHVLLAGLLAAEAAVIRGVNLGGWLVAEEWMTPSLFNVSGSGTPLPDEWTLCAYLGKDKCASTLKDHWDNFITQDDLKQIQNSVRIPIGYWAVDRLDYEPYVGGQYPYLIRAVQWAKDLGLTVFIDIHGVPGSQNGWGLSGLVGPVGFLDNTTNSDRALNVLKNLTQEFMKSEYGGTVTNIEPVNEPTIAYDALRKFYTPAANILGAANNSGINMTFSDGFFNPHSWEDYNPWNWQAQAPAEHMTLDTHQFWAFKPLIDLPKPDILKAICDFATVQLRNPAVQGTPPTLVGEWSLSSGITANSTTDAGQDRDKRTWFRLLFEAQNAAFSPYLSGQASIGWYFWTWKTEYNTDAWSYQKGVQQQYIPSNISDPSTYAFPIKDGCVDSSYNWTAPELSTSSASSSTPTSTGSSAASNASPAAAASSSAKGAAAAIRPLDMVAITAVVSTILALSIFL